MFEIIYSDSNGNEYFYDVVATTWTEAAKKADELEREDEKQEFNIISITRLVY